MPYANRRKRKRNCRLGLQLYGALLTLILVSSLTALLSQKAFATTYVITDGDQTVKCTTFATDPAQVLGKAGVPLLESDSYTTETVDGTEVITVRRACNITVHYHGQTMNAVSTGETAGELLERLGLDVSGEDVVSHGLDTWVYDGMELKVDRIVTKQETYTSTIPYGVTRWEDDSIPTGTEEVLTEGIDGELLCTAGVTYVNGREIQRVVLSQTVTQPPISEVVSVGTGEAAQTDPEGMPVIGDGIITLATGEILTYTDTATIRATAYTHTDAGCDMVTATGTNVHWGTVAVDPRYIPYGTRMFIVSNDGEYVYGIAVAEDCGGDIKGDRMDLYMPTYEQCIQFGRRTCTLYFLG